MLQINPNGRHYFPWFYRSRLNASWQAIANIAKVSTLVITLVLDFIALLIFGLFLGLLIIKAVTSHGTLNIPVAVGVVGGLLILGVFLMALNDVVKLSVIILRRKRGVNPLTGKPIRL